MLRLGRGKWKGHILRPSSSLCRPTSALVRGAVLDMTGMASMQGAMVWDLCAGTGAVGLEALSWGAEHCVFVDSNPRATSLIRSFLRDHDAMDDATVITRDVRDYISLCDAGADIVFFDPPYRSSKLYRWVFQQDWEEILKGNGTVFVESTTAQEVPGGWQQRRYGDSKLNWKVFRSD